MDRGTCERVHVADRGVLVSNKGLTQRLCSQNCHGDTGNDYLQIGLDCLTSFG